MEKPFSAYVGDSPSVFVCYAHDDAGLVYPEIKWLHEQGVNIWYDEGISPGAEFPEELGNAILNSSLVLFYSSPNSIESRHCRDEVYFALDKKIPVLALHLSETELPAGLALSLGTVQAILRYELPMEDYRKKLLSGISAATASTISPIDESGQSKSTGGDRKLFKTLAAAIAVAAIGAAFFFGKSYLDQQAQIRWAKDEAIPEIKAMIDARWKDFTEPYARALEIEKIIPNDPELAEIFAQTSLPLNIDSTPSGATVYYKNYPTPDAEWQLLGTTPIEGLRLPVGIFRWKLEKEGYDTVKAAHSTWDVTLVGKNLLVPNHLHRTLDAATDIPAGMVRVAGGETPSGVVQDFFIDRFEITNAQYQKFIEAGGYRNQAYWKNEFEADGKALTREEAISRFVDQSGRPGPSTWLGGTYPDGEANHPVSGVSWYEAAAYAEFVGHTLPSGTHWGLARGENSTLIDYPQLGGLAIFAPMSNFDRIGTVPVGEKPGVTAFGAYDLAGNVREWCFNATNTGKLARGGAWIDNPYRFVELSHAPAMFREEGYGFRTAYLPDAPSLDEPVFAELSIESPVDINSVPPVSDEVFAVFAAQFDYDPTDLNVRLESRDESSDEWVLERVSIELPYTDDRMIVNVFLPTNTAPPYQTVIYFPGSGSLFRPTSVDIAEYYEYPVFLSFLVRTGRAVVYPVYKGTFERSEDILVPLHMGAPNNAYTEYLTQIVQDFRRTIDYLETRDDIDSEKIAYYGMSWGGMMGGIIPAIEERVKTAIVLGGGILAIGRPESNPVHYASRITVPFLMLVGRYDSLLTHETSAQPLFELLATAPEHKMMRVYETDHIPPKHEYVTEILAWLDKYFGPVGAPINVARK